MDKIFQNVPTLGDLWLEHEFYNYDEPILFTCKDERDIRYLCSCCRLSSQWVLGTITSDILSAMIEDGITLRDVFLKGEVCYFLRRTKHGFYITKNVPSDAFPMAGEYLELQRSEEMCKSIMTKSRIVVNTIFCEGDVNDV